MLIGVAIGVWIWSDARRAHERAVREVKGMLRQTDVQLLDDTVALARVRVVRRRRGGLAFARSYSFDVTRDGVSRLRGTLTITAESVQLVDLPWLEDDDGNTKH
jgi:hypothetical protein